MLEDELLTLRRKAGSPGRRAGDGNMEGNPQMADVVLISGPAHTIAGRVIDANGVSVARTVVLVETLELQLGANTLHVAKLGDQWKAGFLTIPDDKDRYSIGHLPPGWTRATLAVQIPGRGSFRQLVLPRAQDPACAIVIGSGGAM